MSSHRNPRSQLTPAMRRVIDGMARAGRPPLHALTPQQARAAYAAGAGVLEVSPPALARVEDFTLPAQDGHALPARLYAPTREPLPVLLYLHGGGFTVGSIETHDVLCRELSRHGHCAVVSLDYRLAPEYRFPVAVHDAWHALQWLAAHADELGLDGSRLAVGGDSAGGTLAAVCALMARDAGLALALQLLFYPGCTAHADTPSHHTYGQGFVLEAPHIAWFFGQYIDDAERDDWRFAPLNAPDLEGLAPAWFGLAECDPLVDEGVQYADRLRAAGVAVDLKLYRGVAHEFIKMGRAIPEARQAHADAGRALRAAFGADAAMTELRLGNWATLGPDAAALRTAVFIQEQGVPEDMEWDAEDATALHAVGYNRRGQPVATARLLGSDEPGVARIGRMAVRRPLRGSGIGTRVLQALLDVAVARDDRAATLHAQCSAEGFYRRLGFAAQGEVFMDAGIAHIEMTKSLV